MEPLASKIRPKNLNEFVGQHELVGEGKPLRVAIDEKHLFSFVLWGPPGTGKTTLARLYAKSLNADYHELSAVSAGKDDIKKIIQTTDNSQPTTRLFKQKPQILFLDEIHRFNKAQQDFLLPYVESGALTLIGATTENPSFEVIPALLSRMRVFVLHELSEEEITEIISRSEVEMDQNALEFIARIANGDARQALALVENTQKLYGEVKVENIEKALGDPRLRFDKKGYEKYTKEDLLPDKLKGNKYWNPKDSKNASE